LLYIPQQKVMDHNVLLKY